MQARPSLRAFIAMTLLAVATIAPAKESNKPAPKAAPAAKQSEGAAYIDQLGAPANWMTNARFWLAADSVTPPVNGNPSKIVIADPDNVHGQVQSGADEKAFIFQWGRANQALQVQAGGSNRAEVVQVSVGAARIKGANAGAGNGPELDIFGFEIDPGRSQGRNRSPEAGGSGAGATATGNIAVQDQAGFDNFARAVQIGSGNVAEQLQAGSGNQSLIVQLGIQNKAETEQAGDDNTAAVSQQGSGNVAVVRQGER